MAEQTPRTADEQDDLDESLYWAACDGDDKLVQLLVAQGADMDSTHDFKFGRTPLLATSGNGRLSTVKLLVNSGAKLNKKDGDGDNCMHKACWGGHLPVITWLMDQGLGLDTPPNKKGKTPLDVLKQEEENKYLKYVNKPRQECLKALKIVIKDTDDTGEHHTLGSPADTTKDQMDDPTTEVPVDTYEVAGGERSGPDKNKGAKISGFDFNDVEKGIKQVNGKMKVARVLLHGAPLVGKTSVKRLIFNYPPLAKEDENSTQLMEDPVRAISTGKLVSKDDNNLEEVDEAKLIKMIQSEIKAHLAKQRQEKKGPVRSSSSDSANVSIDSNSAPAKVQLNEKSSDERSSGDSHVSSKMSEVLTDICKDIDSLDPSIPPLFDCQFVHLVDSGGQPQFSDLLPLIFQSESHDHIVVIPLNEKLSQKPQNCVNIKGEKFEFPNSLLLTHLQLIERVCQLAKASGSRVVVVGTHLDKENKEETLAEKNKLLEPLLQKYQDNLVPNDEGGVVFAVNAMVPKGEIREKYSKMLQAIILKLCCRDDGKTVPLRWMALELELSRRSKKSGEIIEKSECDEIAKSLGIEDVNDALAFFNELAVHYHYPEAVPGIVFTSVGAISSRLSTIVKASFAHRLPSNDARKLRESGQLSKTYFLDLLSKIPENKSFTTDDFLKLIMHLRIIFRVDERLFIPSLLPVGAIERNLDHYRPEPLVFFWYDNNREVRILPQSFFHALIVELLQRKENVQLSKTEQLRSDIVLTLRSRNEFIVRLVNLALWLEVYVDKLSFSSDDFSFLAKIIHSCSQSVLGQLNLAHSLGDLQYGLRCPKKCGNEFLHLCASGGTGSVLKCLENEQYKWKEDNNARLFWVNCIHQKDVSHDTLSPESLIQKRPELRDAYDLTVSRSAEWNDLGRKLKVSLNYREQLKRDPSSDKDKLEYVLDKWIETDSTPVTWSSLIEALESIELNDVVRAIKEFLQTSKAVQSYSQS